MLIVPVKMKMSRKTSLKILIITMLIIMRISKGSDIDGNCAADHYPEFKHN